MVIIYFWTLVVSVVMVTGSDHLPVLSGSPVKDGDIQNGRTSGNVPRLEQQTNVTNRKTSPECEADYQRYLNALGQTPVPAWASQMRDANAKREAGTVWGNRVWEGSYQQCQQITTGLIGGDGQPMVGKYCKTMWAINLIWITAAGHALCLPSSCTAADVFSIYTDHINSSDLPDQYPPFEFLTVNDCLEKENIMEDKGVIGATTVLAFFGLLSLVGTMYDIITLRKRTPEVSKKNSNSQSKTESNISKVPGGHDNLGFRNVSEMHYSSDNPEEQLEGANRSDIIGQEAVAEVTRFGGPQEEATYYVDAQTGERPYEVIKSHVLNNEYGRMGNGMSTPSNGSVPWKDGPAVISAPDYDDSDNKNDRLVYIPSTFEKILLSFSAYTNIQKLASYDQGPGSYRAVNGIRFLAMCWIVLGHSWQLGITITETPTMENWAQYQVLSDRGSFNIIELSNISVETFFLLSAMLTTISFMKQLKKKNNKPTCAMFGLYYFHRFWRLTPVYMMTLMVWTTYFPHMKSGPLWPKTILGSDNCRETWWRNFIYLNNLIYDEKDCMGWTWYLANDFQFYVIAPAFICLLIYVPIAGIVVTTLGIIGSLCSSITVFNGVFTKGNRYMYADFYIKPWCRSSTYLIGIFLGYLIFKTNRKVKMNKVGVVFGWIFALAAICTAVFVNFTDNESNPWSGPKYIAFETLWRPAFVMGVFWMIFACVTGYGGPINKLMSWTGWVPLAKLTYTGYLIHPIIIYYTYYSSPAQIVVTDWVMINYFLGTLLLTLGFSFMTSLFLEVPFLALEKVMFQNVKK